MCTHAYTHKEAVILGFPEINFVYSIKYNFKDLSNFNIFSFEAENVL